MSRAPRSRPPTAHDVARLAGVSQAAVSRAFSPKASIAPATKAAVMRAAEELGYRPNLLARSLIMRRSRLIGIAMAYLENQFYPQVLEQLCERLRAEGYQTMLHAGALSDSVEPRLEDVLNYGVDALVLASTHLSSTLARRARAAGVPVVLFNRTTDDPGASSVTGDNRHGAEVIARFLAAAGHRRMGFVAGLAGASTNRDREAGFMQGLSALGLPPPLRAVGDYSSEGAAAATRLLLSRSDRPEAIFYANDHMALAGMEVARHEFGLTTPDDLSIIGFDDVGPARWPSFALTTYAQPLAPMVDATLALLMRALSEENAATEHVVVPGCLVVRGSARLPPNGLTEAAGLRTWAPELEDDA
jgi:DNA-binding LacI/PurR family transcriptional regulator